MASDQTDRLNKPADVREGRFVEREDAALLPSVVGLWGGIAVASACAAQVGYVALDSASPDLLAFILAFAGGAVLTMLATSMMPEAYEHAGRSVGVLTVVGFTLAFVIAWLEG